MRSVIFSIKLLCRPMYVCMHLKSGPIAAAADAPMHSMTGCEKALMYPAYLRDFDVNISLFGHDLS